MNSFIWLASYPKSGNTWLRLLLENLLRPSDMPVSINDMRLTDPGIIPRWEIERWSGIDTTILTSSELAELKHEYMIYSGSKLGAPAWIKTHEANIQLKPGQPLIPEEVTKCAIYIARNPLDIIPSLAAHLSLPIEQTIALIEDWNADLSFNRFDAAQSIIPQLLTWKDHVSSWLDSPQFPTLLIRYEDLHANPADELKKVAELTGLQIDNATLERAIDSSRFERLRLEESRSGFRHKPAEMAQFFRFGKTGAGELELSEEQRSRVIDFHHESMKRCSYL